MKRPLDRKSEKTPLSNPCNTEKRIRTAETSGSNETNALSAIIGLEELAGNCPDIMQKLHQRALRAAELIEAVSPFIQEHTDAVCPSCQSVCCINRHLNYSIDDIICIHVLGEKVPLHKKDKGEDSPCQFLGKFGCTVKRSLRPYRCNWYFCNPLLEQIQAGPASRYRQFIHSLEEITRARRHLLEAFEKLNVPEFIKSVVS